MKTPLTLLLIALCITTVLAESSPLVMDEIEIDGQTLKHATITVVTPNRVSIAHDEGISGYSFEQLPQDLAAKLGMTKDTADIAKAAQADAEMAAAQRKADALAKKKQEQKLIDSSKQMRIMVLQVLPEGVLADPMESYAIADELAARGGGGPVALEYQRSGKTIYIEGLTGVVEDEQKELIVARIGDFKYEDTLGAARTIEKWKVLPQRLSGG